jgi:hypothetical protein
MVSWARAADAANTAQQAIASPRMSFMLTMTSPRKYETRH